jgi:hypothetical protein
VEETYAPHHCKVSKLVLQFGEKRFIITYCMPLSYKALKLKLISTKFDYTAEIFFDLKL